MRLLQRAVHTLRLTALRWRPKFAQKPSERIGHHWIGRYHDLFNVIAFGALKRA